jgi:DnaD/phage-associated family protein
MEILINFSAFSGIFALPADVVDLYINEAGCDDLRVLLYVFRHCCGEKLDLARMSDALGLPEKAIGRALAYWAGKGLLTASPLPAQEEAARVPAESPGAAASKPAAAAQAAPRRPAAKVLDTPIQYTAAEIAEKAKRSEEIRFLLEAVPEKLGRLISPAECSSILYLHDGAGLPADVILMVFEYCVSIGKGNLRYIEKTALGWAEDGISTHELAEQKILQLEKRRSFEGKVKALMGISGRALSQTERQHLSRWALEWDISPELVSAAYDICVSRTGKLSFSYINSILKSWHEKGIETPEQAKNERRQGAPSTRPQTPSFNVDEYVRLSMKRLHEE